MIDTLIAWLRIATASLLLTVNTLVHIPPLLLVALVKLLIRAGPVRRGCNRALTSIAASWIDINSSFFRRLSGTRVLVDGLPEARMSDQMLVICNHQSWVDIPVLQMLFNRRLPLLRFFLKSQLIWVPLLGLAWWALDFPFMKRYSRAQIERRPELAGRDIEATRRACRKFRELPVAIVNFVEGTRFTAAKQRAQKSPFRHLLKPRAGGVAFTLDAMGKSLDTLVDVTIAYPAGRPSLADLFARRVPEIRVQINTQPIPDRLRGGDYRLDPEFRLSIQRWINELWTQKELKLARMLTAVPE